MSIIKKIFKKFWDNIEKGKKKESNKKQYVSET